MILLISALQNNPFISVFPTNLFWFKKFLPNLPLPTQFRQEGFQENVLVPDKHELNQEEKKAENDIEATIQN